MHLRESKGGFMGEVEGKKGRGEVSLYFNFKNKKNINENILKLIGSLFNCKSLIISPETQSGKKKTHNQGNISGSLQ